MEGRQSRNGVGYRLGIIGGDHSRRHVLRSHVVKTDHGFDVERRARVRAVKAMLQLCDSGSDDMLRPPLTTLGFRHGDANLKDRKSILNARGDEVCKCKDISPAHSCVGKSSFATRQLVHVDKNLAIQGRPLDSNFAVPHGLLE